ncbi:MAG TPA: YdcF family protein [Acidimicrobiales bacterium]|nr:YdcF family protein [Acidimicrobiales bacterium]
MAIAIGAAASALLALFVAVTFAQVWAVADDDQAGPADAIVVLGAAQYDGDPSPVLQARLDHAFELWDAGHAALIVVTGGRQSGDRFTQAQAGYRYLRDRGVPDPALLLEVDGDSTYTEMAATARILRARGLDSALMVSDGYHSRRLLDIADEVGLDGAVSPTDTGFGVRDLVRETAAVSAGRLVGFRRLDALG